MWPFYRAWLFDYTDANEWTLVGADGGAPPAAEAEHHGLIPNWREIFEDSIRKREPEEKPRPRVVRGRGHATIPLPVAFARGRIAGTFHTSGGAAVLVSETLQAAATSSRLVTAGGRSGIAADPVFANADGYLDKPDRDLAVLLGLEAIAEDFR